MGNAPPIHTWRIPCSKGEHVPPCLGRSYGKHRGIVKRWVAQSGGGFFLIVDDGGHRYWQMKTSFDGLFPQALVRADRDRGRTCVCAQEGQTGRSLLVVWGVLVLFNASFGVLTHRTGEYLHTGVHTIRPMFVQTRAGRLSLGGNGTHPSLVIATALSKLQRVYGPY